MDPVAPPRVLLVEDEPNVRKMLERFLGTTYDCLPAGNGKEALELVRSDPTIDVVVTDVRMPEMDGLQLIRAIKRHRPHLPAIAMTAYGSEETAIEALRAGASNYLRKPFKTQDFLAVVRKCIEIAQARKNRNASFAYLREATKVFEVPARLELARALLPHLTEGIADLGLVEAADLINLDVALEEALSNAVIHGSLLMTEDAHKLRSDREAFERAYQARRSDPRFASKTITVSVRATPTEVAFVVEDRGPGFDPAALTPANQLTTLQGVHGRGLMLIRLFMDEVVHENGGRRLRMVKRAAGRRAGTP